MGDDRDRGHRRQREPEHQPRERASAPRAAPGRRRSSRPTGAAAAGRRGRRPRAASVDLGVRGDQADAQPSEHEHDRIRDRDDVRDPHQDGRAAARARSAARCRSSPESTIAALERVDPPSVRRGPRRGPRAGRDGAGHVRGLPVPLLHRRVPDRAAGPRPAGRPAAVRVPPLSAPRCPPRRRARRRGRRGGRHPGRLLADARPALRVPRGPLRRTTSSPTRPSLASTRTASPPSSMAARTPPASSGTWRAARRAVSRARPASSSAGACTTAPSTPSSLITALEATA